MRKPCHKWGADSRLDPPTLAARREQRCADGEGRLFKSENVSGPNRSCSCDPPPRDGYEICGARWPDFFISKKWPNTAQNRRCDVHPHFVGNTILRIV